MIPSLEKETYWNMFIVFYSKFFVLVLLIFLHDICTRVATVRMVYLEPVRCDMKSVIIQIKAEKLYLPSFDSVTSPFQGFYEKQIKTLFLEQSEGLI